MTLRLIIEAKQAGRVLLHGTQIAQERIARTIEATANEASVVFLKRGRADIRAAGKFGRRWTEGLQAEVGITPEASTVEIFHRVPYWRVFEFGATIKGKPMLWIPLSFAKVPKGMWARDYPGGLFRVERRGKAPLLFSIRERRPKYFGKKQVRIPKKFHLRTIAAEVSRSLRTIYSKHFRRNVGG